MGMIKLMVIIIMSRGSRQKKKIIFWYDSLAKLSSGGSSCYSLIETIF